MLKYIYRYREEVINVETVRQKFRRPEAIFAIYSAVEYLVFHLLYLFVDGYLDYSMFLIRFSACAVPVTLGAMLLRRDRSFSATVLTALSTSLTRLIFFIPFFYIEFLSISSTPGALLISLLTSLATAVLCALLSFICYLVIGALLGVYTKKLGTEPHLPMRAFDFSNPLSKAVFFIPFLAFIGNLIYEIITTVIFFRDAGSIFYIDDIVWLVAAYVYLIVSLILCCVFCSYTLNRLMMKRVKIRPEYTPLPDETLADTSDKSNEEK